MDIEPTTNPVIDTMDEAYPGRTKEDQILEQARDRVQAGYKFWKENYDLSDLDRKFLAGDQWPEEIKEERAEDNRPMLTVNKLPQYVNRVANDMKQNRTQIKCHAVEGNVKDEEAQFANLAGSKDYTQAEIMDALISDIEYNSQATDHYDRASDQMVAGAIGWLRVYAKYNENDVFDVDLVIDSVANPTSAMIDQLATDPGYADAMWGTITTQMPDSEFAIRYPDARKGALFPENDANSWWYTDESVTVTEYLTKEPDKYTAYQMNNGEVWDSRDIPKEFIQAGEGEIEGTDFIENPDNLFVKRQRKIDGTKIVWRKITAWDILEGGVEGIRQPFTTIPLVPVLGQEIVLPNTRRYTSLIRNAIDPQREFNYWRTAAVEMVALAPKMPFIGTALNFENNKEQWDNANRKNYSKISYTPDQENGGMPPQRQPPANNPVAEMTQAMSADDSIKSTTGMYDASLGQDGRDESGRAILAKQSQSDIGSFHFTDKRDKAIARIGKLLVEGIPKAYNEERVVRLRFPDNTEDWVRINSVFGVNETTGEDILVNDITYGKYDVRITSGPAYATQRIEAVNSLIDFINAVPEAGAMAMDIIARNMDFPGAEELAERLKRVIPQQALDPNDDDAEQPAPPPVDPNMELLAATEQSKTEGKSLEVALQESKNEGKILDIQQSEIDKTEQIKDVVAQSLAEIMGQPG